MSKSDNKYITQIKHDKSKRKKQLMKDIKEVLNRMKKMLEGK